MQQTLHIDDEGSLERGPRVPADRAMVVVDNPVHHNLRQGLQGRGMHSS